METAAVAADELSGSINEIGRQLAKTTEIVRSAVGEGRAPIIRSPRGAGRAKIGDVIKLIRAIAGKTNPGTQCHHRSGSALAKPAKARRGRLRGQVAGGRPPRRPRIFPG